MDFKGQVLCLMTQKEIKIITDTEPEEKTLLGAGHITGKTHIYLDKMCQQSDWKENRENPFRQGERFQELILATQRVINYLAGTTNDCFINK